MHSLPGCVTLRHERRGLRGSRHARPIAAIALREDGGKVIGCHESFVSCFVVKGITICFCRAMSRCHLARREAVSIELSRRERQCLALAAQGRDDRAIGELLHLSRETVHWYIKRLMRRLGMSTRTQAVVWALQNGQLTFAEVMPREEAGGKSS